MPMGTPSVLKPAGTAMAGSPDLRERLGAAGRQRVRGFSAENTERRTRDLYEAVLARDKPPAGGASGGH